MDNPLFYRRRQLAEKLGVSTIWTYRHEGVDGFPRAVKLGDGTSGFLASEISAWLDGKAAEREVTTAEAD